ncbi:MAG: hypothetical protein ACRELY_11135 [Polyangiaceae bacterium]
MSPSRLHASKRFAFVGPAAFLAAVLMVACSSSSGDDASSSSDSGTDGGRGGDGDFVDSNTDPCAGLGCASRGGSVEIRVLDGNGDPVPSPTFNANGNPAEAICETDAGQILEDAGTCDPWTLDTLDEGTNTITISAVGYEPGTVTVDVLGPNGCCGIGPTVDASVTLNASADAGDGG